MSEVLPPANSLVTGQQSQSWLLPVSVVTAALMGGAGSQMAIDACIRLGAVIAIVVIVLVVVVRASPTRVNPAK
ncbi:hypothetical protein ACFWBF_22720 [Streptomyces sp. NPDC060028]|uniref:hypothetical protein n=1 Tax=Streptomyces sp. NPDC060028 TaxID=3347041 RepID=UPI0036B358D6